MGDLGDGTGTAYPSALDTDTLKEINYPNAGMTLARADVPNDLAAAVVAIETALGTTPQGTAASVKAFLQNEHSLTGQHGNMLVSSLTSLGDIIAPNAKVTGVTAGTVEAGSVNAVDVSMNTLNSGPVNEENVIINGTTAVDQRNTGAAQTITAAAALAYTVDRWYAYCTGANVTGQRVAGSAQTQYRYRFTGAASVTAIGFGTRLEAANAAHLAGRSCMLSVDLGNTLLTSVTWTVSYANSANAFGTIASPTVTQIATGTFTVGESVRRYNQQINIPLAATTGIQIVFTVGAQTSGTWSIGEVSLKDGVIATPFEHRPFQQELALCRRYLPTHTIPLGGYGYSGQCYSTTAAVFFLPFDTVPYSAPTGMTMVNGTLAATNSGVTSAGGTAAVYAASLSGGVVTVTGATGLVAGNASMLMGITAVVTLLWTGCEL